MRTLGPLDPLAVSGSERADERLVVRQLFETLVAYDPDTLKPEPGLASSWTSSADARTFTFQLRRAVFHDGRELTAADVLWSLNRLARAACAPEVSVTAAAPAYLLSLVNGYAEVAGSCKAETLSGLTAVGERTVMVSLTEPWADFPSALGNLGASIVPAGLGGVDEATFRSRPIGTGPYKVEVPWNGNTVRLVRHEPYWGLDGPVPAVRFVAYGDDAAAYLDFLGGKLHYAPVPPNRIGQARRRFGESTFAIGVGVSFFGFNLASQRMTSPEFRLGLSRAVDRASIATAVFEGTRQPARGLAPPSLPGADGNTCGAACRFNAAAAREAIAQAYPRGAPEITVGVSEVGPNPEVAAALVRMFAAAGVTARLVQRPFVDHIQGLRAADVDVFQLGWVPDYPALDGLLTPLFRSGAKDNYMHFADPEVDRLLREARPALDDDRRHALFTQAERVVLRSLPVIPLLWYRASIVVDPRLQPLDKGKIVDGLGLTGFGRLRFVTSS